MADPRTYVVRLVDCAKARGGGVGDHAAGVLTLLKTWYGAVCQRATSAGTVWTADIGWLEQPTQTPQGSDAGAPFTINMLLFFVPIPRDSVILLHPSYASGFELPSVRDHSVGGLTVTEGTIQGGQQTPTLAISEIYIERSRGTDQALAPLRLAKLAFHESMHNQLNKGAAALHSGEGFAKPEVLGDAPSAANILAMAQRIGVLMPQWVGGMDAWNAWERERPK